MTPIIVPMQPDDVTACLRVIAQCWNARTAQMAEDDLREMFLSPRFAPKFYVACVQGKIVGLSGHIASWKNWGIRDLIYTAVIPSHQRRGIGRLLVGKCLLDADDLDCAVMLTTHVPDFYRGFEFASLDEDLVCIGKSNVLMRRQCLSQRVASSDAPSTMESRP